MSITTRDAAVATMWTDLIIMVLLAIDVYIGMKRAS